MWEELRFVGQAETRSYVLVRVKKDVQLTEEGHACDNNSYHDEK